MVLVGHVEGVCRTEINWIKHYSGLGLGDSSKLLYVNTCKRARTRLFAEEVGGLFQNPLPGAVVDLAITDKDTYEFYLVSVAARQGMPTPTRYTVVYDAIGASPHML
jgi:hypothetical protein